ncbi:MAG: hypothetical protein JWP57_3846 [Spirosoma sp.]|nr:hypothetical protein [Spirosoma sp.]
MNNAWTSRKMPFFSYLYGHPFTQTPFNAVCARKLLTFAAPLKSE